MYRKTFLKYTGLLGLGALAIDFKPIAETARFNNRLCKVSQTRGLMGTWVAITAMHPSAAEAEDAIEDAFLEMGRISQLLNRYDSDSAIGTLNCEGHLEDLPSEALIVLQRAAYFFEQSGGNFDITVAPLVNLFRTYFTVHGRPPDDGLIEDTLKRVDGNAVQLHGRNLILAGDGMEITLDGIAKGFIVDCAARLLRIRGLEHVLINAGGDIFALGGRSERSPWRVVVRKPGAEHAWVERIDLDDGAIATSGNYEVYFDAEKVFHHIVSPETGRSPLHVSSVTVRADTAMDADALSTTLFVLGPVEGIRFSRQLGNECFILNNQGKRFSSPGWKAEHLPAHV